MLYFVVLVPVEMAPPAAPPPLHSPSASQTNAIAKTIREKGNDYVILSMQRSATTTLCHDLNAEGLTCLYELLNMGSHQSGFQWKQRLNLSETLARSQPSAFVQLVRSFLSPQKQVGYKVFPQHVTASNLQQMMTTNTTCVIYWREDVVAQYRSWKIAHTTGCWTTNGSAECHNASMAADEHELQRFERMRDAWYADVRELSWRCGHVINVTMETYLKNRRSFEWE